MSSTFFFFHHFVFLVFNEKETDPPSNVSSLSSLSSLCLSFSLFQSMSQHYGLEIRKCWADELLSGRKTIELRGYPLPGQVGKILICNRVFSSSTFRLSLSFLSSTFSSGKKKKKKGSSRVWLLATDGPHGQAALFDTIDPLRDRDRAQVVGWARFQKEKEKTYRSAEEVEADEGEHLVCASPDSNPDSPSSVYGWREGVTEVLYGWNVAEVKRTEEAGKRVLLVPGKRLLRSVYQLERAPDVTE